MGLFKRIKEIKQGKELFKLGAFDQAIEQFSMAVYQKKDINTYYLLAQAYFNNKDFANTRNNNSKTIRKDN